MNKTIINPKGFVPTSDMTFFIDTNIWFCLFYPTGNIPSHIVAIYSKLFLEILKAKSTIIVPNLVLSEFFNRYLKNEHYLLDKLNPGKFVDYKKDFRGSLEYKNAVITIKNIVENKILKFSSKVNDSFESIDLNNILIAEQDYDFNDLYFLELSTKHNAYIITNDKDFLNYNTTAKIITTHK